MHTLSLEALDTVTGGISPTLPTTTSGGGTSSSSGSSSSDAALQALQGLQSSIADIAKNQNQGLFSGPNGPLLMMTMAMAFSRRGPDVVVYGGHHGWGYHWGW